MKKRLRDRASQRLGHIRQHYRRRNAYWFSALKYAWRTTLRIGRSKITAGVALRCALGFVLPLAIGVGTGHVVIGVTLAGGSASVAVVGMTYPYRARVRTAIREGQPVAEFPALHAELESLKQMRKTRKLLRPASEDDLRIVLTEALRIVVSTVAQIGRQRWTPAVSAALKV